MPSIPENPIDPTFNIIRKDIHYYMKIGGDSADVGKQILDTAFNAVESIIPLPGLTALFFGALDIASNPG
jgi:spore maturation protein SpmA